MIRRPPRSTHCISSAASDVYKRQIQERPEVDSSGRWVIRIGRQLQMLAGSESFRLCGVLLDCANHLASAIHFAGWPILAPAIHPHVRTISAFVELQVSVLIPNPHRRLSPFGPGWPEHCNCADIQASSADSRKPPHATNFHSRKCSRLRQPLYRLWVQLEQLCSWFSGD